MTTSFRQAYYYIDSYLDLEYNLVNLTAYAETIPLDGGCHSREMVLAVTAVIFKPRGDDRITATIKTKVVEAMRAEPRLLVTCAEHVTVC